MPGPALPCPALRWALAAGIVLYGTPLFALVLVPVGSLYVYIGNYYRYGERDLKRIIQVTICNNGHQR